MRPTLSGTGYSLAMAPKQEKRVVLFRRGGAMFSNLWSVTGFLEWAESSGVEPLIDFQTEKPMNYWECTEPRNGWTDYFEQTSPLSLDDVLSSQSYEVFTSRPRGFPTGDYSQSPGYAELFLSRIHLNALMDEYVDQWLAMLRQCSKPLGVHFRGTDMRVAKSHWAPPTGYQMLRTVDLALDTHHFDHIFVATEDDRNLTFLRRRYGSMVVTSDSFRTDKEHKMSRIASPVLQWRYLLGKQVIRDTWLLGHCEGLVSGHSNVSEHAQVLSESRYKINLQIRRPRVDLLGSHSWAIRVTNLARELSTSRFRGVDFQVYSR